MASCPRHALNAVERDVLGGLEGARGCQMQSQPKSQPLP